MSYRVIILLGAVLLWLTSACNFDPREPLQWQADLLTPIAKSTVGLNDVIPDSIMIPTNGQNFVSLVFRDSVAQTNLSDLIEIPDTNLDIVVTLDSLTLDPGTIVQQVSLGQIAQQLINSGNFTNRIIGQLIIDSHDSTLTLPDISDLPFDNIPVDASQFFEFAVVESGYLKLTIENELPLAMEDVEFFIRNSNSGTNIISDTFPTIPSKGRVEELYDMSGKTIESQLLASLAKVTLKGGVLKIDTSDFIRVTLEPIDLKVQSAKAVFPGQTVIDSTTEITYRFPDDFADVELTKIVVSGGRLRAFSKSEIPDTVLFNYSLPTADRNGEVPSVTLKLNPAMNGMPAIQEQTADLAGFTIDLRGENGDIFNTIVQRYTVDLLYSGRQVEIDKDDKIEVSFGLLDLEPVYVEGYIGKQKFAFDGKEAIDIFDDLDIGRLEFQNAIGRITFANSIGIDSKVDIRNITARNSKTGNAVQLIGPANRTNSLVTVNGPNLPDTNEVVLSHIEFSGTNGNLDDFVNVLPDELVYDFEILGNYNGQPGLHDNFATNKSEIGAYVEFELPLEGIVENFRLTDTATLSFDPSTSEDVDEVNGGFLRAIIENQYPFEGTVTAKILDESKRVITVLSQDQVIAAGHIFPATGRVEQPTKTVMEKTYTQELLQDIIKNGQYLSLNYVMHTKPDGTHARIYSDYTIKAKLIGQFNYNLKP